MAKLKVMAPDSAGFKVLIRLYQLGGHASIDALTDTLWSEFRSVKRFHQIASEPLTMRGFAKLVENDCMAITPEGQLMVEHYKSLLPRQRQVTALTSTLNVAKYLQWGHGRPGALDYRDIPSVMGGERVPYGETEQGAAE